jgi:hypothetical protein
MKEMAQNPKRFDSLDRFPRSHRWKNSRVWVLIQSPIENGSSRVALFEGADMCSERRRFAHYCREGIAME